MQTLFLKIADKYKVQVDMIESDYKVFMKQSNRLIRRIQTS